MRDVRDELGKPSRSTSVPHGTLSTIVSPRAPCMSLPIPLVPEAALKFFFSSCRSVTL